MLKKSRTGAAALSMLLGVSGLGLSQAAVAAADDSKLIREFQENGVGRAAIAQLPPYAFIEAGKEPSGYLIEISRWALQQMDVPKIEATVTTFGAMIPGLRAGQVDFVPSGLNITAARCEVVAFTQPVTVQQDAVYTVEGNPKGITGYRFIADNPEVKAAFLSGSTQEAFALAQGVTRDQLVSVPDVQSGISTVVSGRADTFVVGQFSVPQKLREGVDFVVDSDSPRQAVGIAFRQEDADARDAFNEKFDEMRANGEMEALYGKWGFDNWAVLKETTDVSMIVPGCE